MNNMFEDFSKNEPNLILYVWFGRPPHQKTTIIKIYKKTNLFFLAAAQTSEPPMDHGVKFILFFFSKKYIFV